LLLVLVVLLIGRLTLILESDLSDFPCDRIDLLYLLLVILLFFTCLDFALLCIFLSIENKFFELLIKELLDVLDLLSAVCIFNFLSLADNRGKI